MKRKSVTAVRREYVHAPIGMVVLLRLNFLLGRAQLSTGLESEELHAPYSPSKNVQ